MRKLFAILCLLICASSDAQPILLGSRDATAARQSGEDVLESFLTNAYAIATPRWQDLRVSLISSKAGGSNDPSFTKIRDNGAGSQGTFGYSFSPTSEQELYTSVQMPHGFLKTTVTPHIHWMPTTTAAGSVTWGIEYTVTNYGAVVPANSTVASFTQLAGTAYTHHILDLGSIDVSAWRDSCILSIRLFRVATADTDSYGGGAIATDFDIHYQVREPGSLEEHGDN